MKENKRLVQEIADAIYKEVAENNNVDVGSPLLLRRYRYVLHKVSTETWYFQKVTPAYYNNTNKTQLTKSANKQHLAS